MSHVPFPVLILPWDKLYNGVSARIAASGKAVPPSRLMAVFDRLGLVVENKYIIAPTERSAALFLWMAGVIAGRYADSAEERGELYALLGELACEGELVVENGTLRAVPLEDDEEDEGP